MGWQPPPSRMLWTGALLLLAALGGAGGARSCPLQLRGCKCVGERPKGLAPARKRVSCSGEELREPPAPPLLPNDTITLILSNNKITTLKNSTFLGLRVLEKLTGLSASLEAGTKHSLMARDYSLPNREAAPEEFSC